MGDNKMKAGFIGFLPKDEKADIIPILKDYAGLGYSGIEGGDNLFRRGDPAENLKKIKSFGLEPLAVRARITEELDIPEIIRRAGLLGVNRAAIFVGTVGMHHFSGSPSVPGYDEVMKEIELMEGLAGKLSREGLTLSFHNHHVEFLTCYKGLPAFYLIKENTDLLKFELDCGWVSYAGYDPVTVMRSLGDRLAAVHIKDYVPGEVSISMPDGKIRTMPRFTTPGTGVLDLKGCLKAASEMNTDYAIVEQDFQYRLTEKETLAAAYLNMKESGFVS